MQILSEGERSFGSCKFLKNFARRLHNHWVTKRLFLFECSKICGVCHSDNGRCKTMILSSKTPAEVFFITQKEGLSVQRSCNRGFREKLFNGVLRKSNLSPMEIETFSTTKDVESKKQRYTTVNQSIAEIERKLLQY